ncbi:MAG TPA: class F sortase [Jiangellaceae bacterium]
MPTKSVTTRLRPPVLAAAMTAALVTAGCSGQADSPPDLGRPVPVESPTSDSQAGAAPSTDSLGTGTPTAAPDSHDTAEDSAPLGPPTAIEFAGTRSTVVSVGVDEAAALEIPGDVNTVGWWQDGAEPGASEGFVVITGHATRQGDAAANEWWNAEPGDRVVLEAEHGTATYRVVSRQTYSYEDVPLARWFPAGGPSGPAGLALITCADYRDGEWRSNLVVEAVPE